jgi:hypothetical protein
LQTKDRASPVRKSLRKIRTNPLACELRTMPRRAGAKEDTMAAQIVMDHTGDTRHQFDPADAAAVAKAEVRFKKLTGEGLNAATRLRS